jgi:hypothetical protein
MLTTPHRKNTSCYKIFTQKASDLDCKIIRPKNKNVAAKYILGMSKLVSFVSTARQSAVFITQTNEEQICRSIGRQTLVHDGINSVNKVMAAKTV